MAGLEKVGKLSLFLGGFRNSEKLGVAKNGFNTEGSITRVKVQ